MKKIIMLTLFFASILTGNCQKIEKLEFVNYDGVIEDIFASGSSSDSRNKWNYEYILLLDSSEIRRINEIRPDIVKDFRKNYSRPIQERYRKKISTDIKSIKECFNTERVTNLILKNTFVDTELSDKRLNSPVYIKKDKTAVYEVYGESWSECDRITLTKDGLLIEVIYLLQE